MRTVTREHTPEGSRFLLNANGEPVTWWYRGRSARMEVSGSLLDGTYTVEEVRFHPRGDKVAKAAWSIVWADGSTGTLGVTADADGVSTWTLEATWLNEPVTAEGAFESAFRTLCARGRRARTAPAPEAATEAEATAEPANA